MRLQAIRVAMILLTTAGLAACTPATVASPTLGSLLTSEPTPSVAQPTSTASFVPAVASAPSPTPELPKQNLLTIVNDADGHLDEIRIVSPDGETLVSRDVFTQTSSAFGYFVGYPSVSSDGRWLWVTKGADAIESYFINLETFDVRPAPHFGSIPSWSPTGDRFVVAAGGALTIYDMATGETTGLTQGGSFEAAWSPSGDWIAYYQSIPDTQSGSPTMFPVLELRLIHPDGTGESTLATDVLMVLNDVNLSQAIGDQRPAWSPDSAQIAYSSGSLNANGEPAGNGMDISIVDVDSGEARVASRQPGNEGALTWSPDGTLIAFCNTDEPRPAVFVVDPLSNALTRVSPERGDMQFTSPAWDSDGRWIAMNSAYGDDVPSVAAAKPDGSDFRVVGPTTYTFQRPIWMPSQP